MPEAKASNLRLQPCRHRGILVPTSVLRLHRGLARRFSILVTMWKTALPAADAGSARKKILYLVHKTFRARIVPVPISLVDFFQFVQQLLLAISKAYRGLYHDMTH